MKVCGCCLGHSSSDANEIVECDGCGISVHEGCYGVLSEPGGGGGGGGGADDDGTASEVSAASTEPWFCEPCRAGVPTESPPPCELCPVRGGIYKQTDVGRWVHLVCALYVPGVAFGDPERLTHVTVFEMNYSSWGRRACSLCQDARLARAGVCVQCDAGLCRSYFHAMCAQAHGLLTEPSFHADADSDPYLAHCKVRTSQIHPTSTYRYRDTDCSCDTCSIQLYSTYIAFLERENNRVCIFFPPCRFIQTEL